MPIDALEEIEPDLPTVIGRATTLRREALQRTGNEWAAPTEDLHEVHHHVIAAHRYKAHLETSLTSESGSAQTSVDDLGGIDRANVIGTAPPSRYPGHLEIWL